MFIAMNRFCVLKGCEGDFEHVWLSRDTHLHKVPGFVEFHLLKGPQADDHTLYAYHTVWESRAAFEKPEAREQARKAIGLLKQAGWEIKDGKMTDKGGKKFAFEHLLNDAAFERLSQIGRAHV